MPSARPAAAASRAARTAGAGAGRSRPRRVSSRPPRLRVRWDRAGRIALLVVLTVVVGLYVQHALTLLQTHSRAQRQLAIVQRLRRQNAALVKDSQSLNDPTTIQQRARALGMVRPGERPYVVTSLPSH